MTTFYLLIFATLAFDFVLLGALVWLFHTERGRAYRIPGWAPMKVSAGERLKNMSVIGTLSLVATLGLIFGLKGVLLEHRATEWWWIALEAVAILTVYDFAYYWMHRVMHDKRLMRFVHGVHHRARNPTALESLYQHPAELLAGLSLLMLSTGAVVAVAGPVHPYAFVAAFFVYSTLNILVHSGLDFPTKLLEPINFLARKHHVHHAKDFGKNYSSLTPLPDLLFRTSG